MTFFLFLSACHQSGGVCEGSSDEDEAGGGEGNRVRAKSFRMNMFRGSLVG